MPHPGYFPWPTPHGPAACANLGVVREVAGSQMRRAATAAGVLALLLAACVGGGEARLATAVRPEVGAGEVAHRFGRLGQSTLGECEDAVSWIAAAGQGAVLVTRHVCQVCCGSERSISQPAEPMEVLRLQPDGMTRKIPLSPRSPDASPPNVWDVGPDGSLYGVADGAVVRFADSRWSVLATVEDLGEAIAGQTFFILVDVAPDGAVYASTRNGVARVDEGNRRWLITPTHTQGDFTPQQPGATAPPNPTLQIAELEADGNRVIVVTTDQVRSVTDAGEVRVLLDAQTGATTPAAAIAPKQVSGTVTSTSCCTGATVLGGAALSPAGNLYVLDAFAGRVLRIPPQGPVSVVGGPSGPRYEPCDGCLPKQHFGDRADRVVPADRFAFVPVLVGHPTAVLAFSDTGSLFVALGAHGLVEIGGIDAIPGR